MLNATLLFGLVWLVATLVGCGSDGQDSAPLSSHPSAAAVEVTLLHTNDTHSQVEGLTPYGEPEQGGVARRQTAVDSVRHEVGAENCLLLDAGDFTQGTLYYSVWHGAADIMALNALGYDAVTLGNHEFDRGPQPLAATLAGSDVTIGTDSYPAEELTVPIVVSNLDLSAEPALADWVHDTLIIDRASGSFGLIGAVPPTLEHISNSGPTVVVEEVVASLQAAIYQLWIRGINKIILLSHLGYQQDLVLAAQLSGVDVIISGHDHSLLLPPAPDEGGFPASLIADSRGDYPTLCADLNGAPVLVVSAYEKGRILGRLDLEFDGTGLLIGWSGQPIVLDETFAEDPALLARLADYQEPMALFNDLVVGATTTMLDGNRIPGVRSQQMPLGDLVADAVLANAARYDTSVAAIINGGSIRGGLPQLAPEAGEAAPYSFSYGDVLNVLPFDSTIINVTVSGRQLVAALDNGLSWAYSAEQQMALSSGAFPQLSGLEVTYCQERLLDIQAGIFPPAACPDALLDGGLVTAVTIGGQPLDLERNYRIATNDFLAGGGDFYLSLEQACSSPAGECRDSGMLVRDAFANYVTGHSPLVAPMAPRLIAE